MINQLIPVLQQGFEGLIWKIATDETEKTIALETRNLTSREVYYSAFNYQTGQCYFKEICFPENSQRTLDKTAAGMIFLHGYMRKGSPERNGITALNKQGEIAWERFNIALDHINGDILSVFNTKILPRSVDFINALSGEKVNQDNTSGTEEANILFPETFRGPVPFAELGQISGPVLKLDFNQKSVWSFHTRKNDYYEQYIIVTQDNRIILQDMLDGPIQKLNPEAFFIQQEYLIYTKNKSVVFSYLV